MNNCAMTTEPSWLAWRDRCAAGLCSPEHEAELRRFGEDRYRRHLKRWLSRTGNAAGTGASSDAQHAWHLLETHARTTNTRAGKRYKDWLLVRAEQGDSWLAMMESGATLMMRDVVREQLRRERSPAFATSLQQAMGGGDHGDLTLEDLLPGDLNPATEAAEREWRQLARDLAADIHPTLSLRDRIVVWARDEGVVLNDQRLADWANCSAGSLYAAYQQVVSSLGKRIQNLYPSESPAEQIYLARLTLSALHDRIAVSIGSEKRASRFFRSP